MRRGRKVRFRPGWHPAWFVLFAALVSLALLGAAARGAGPLPGDLAVTRLLQGVPANGTLGLVLLYAGDVAWFLPVVALVVAMLTHRWRGALFVLSAGVASVLAGEALKLLVRRPRPSADLGARYEVPEDYGFPSATARFIVVVLGVACYLILRSRAPRPAALAATGASAVVIATVGLSRVYVGEHWASDVLGGWLSGGALLLVTIFVFRTLLAYGVGGRGAAGSSGTRDVP